MLDVWEHFDFGKFGEYMEMYMELDVILLQCVVEKLHKPQDITAIWIL